MITDTQKTQLIEQLKKTSIVQTACEKIGISRMTYYRWVKTNKQFAREAAEAIIEGRLFVNDVAENQILALIKDRKFEAIKFWLAHNHPRYANKLELTGAMTHIPAELTKSQKQLIRKALRLAALNKNVYDKKN